MLRRAPRRASDRLQLFAEVMVVLCIAGFAYFGHQEVNRLSGVVHRLGHDEQERVTDLRAQCRRTSAKTAQDVNLNWEYYESELKLGQPAHVPANAVRLFEALTPQAQAFLMALEKANKPSSVILRARARADFNAAFVKARTVDFHDAGTIKSPTPRQWVLKAHFSCDRVYSR